MKTVYYNFFCISSFSYSSTGLNMYFLLKFSMNYSPDFLRNLSSLPFRPPHLVRRRNFFLKLPNFKLRSRFLQNRNSHRKFKNKLTKPLPYPTLSSSNNDFNFSLLNTRSLDKESLHSFNLLTFFFVELFHYSLFIVNFMLMTLTSLLYFLNMNYLLLPLKFLLVLVK